ncbi:hypothetical protein BC829DRAFT_440855 [Chytridium lagenaria]|nr:hypothetical protein BC829DRAFT_440855 [Chytridium lagenaria]
MRASIILAAAISTLAHITPAFTAVCSKGKYFDKVLTIILENEDASSAFSDPYLGTTLAAQGYALTNMLGTTHPSQPNYISMIGGDILGVTSNSNKDLAQTNLVDLLELKALLGNLPRGLPRGCATAASYSNGLYRRKHNPLSPSPHLPKTRTEPPRYMFYTPNMDNDGHDTSVGYASNWLKDGLLLGAGIKGKGLKDSTKYTHYSGSRPSRTILSRKPRSQRPTATKMPLISGGCGSGTSITTAIPPLLVLDHSPIPLFNFQITILIGCGMQTPCAHSICATGVALKATCDPCVAKIIAADSYCGTPAGTRPVLHICLNLTSTRKIRKSDQQNFCHNFAEQQAWPPHTGIPLEANPEFVAKLGVDSAYNFTDIWSLDDEMLSFVPRPVLAVLLLFPITPKKAEEERLKAEGVKPPSSVYFLRQTIGNACGTIGILHALGNNLSNLHLADGALKRIIERGEGKSPEERGSDLEKDEDLAKLHDESSREEVDLHFVALVKVDGRIYELDGRKPFPIDHGPAEELLEGSVSVIKKFMSREPDEVNFTVIALAKSQDQ